MSTGRSLRRVEHPVREGTPPLVLFVELCRGFGFGATEAPARRYGSDRDFRYVLLCASPLVWLVCQRCQSSPGDDMAENIASALKEAVLGSDQDEIIKAGTLTVTRGIGVIAVAFVGTFYLLDQFGDKGPWHGLTTPQKLTFVIAAALVWAIVASGDAIARGLATARQNDLVASLPTGLRATKTDGTDSAGWSVVAVKFSPGAGADGPEYLLVKAGQAASWLPAEKISFG